MASGEFFQLSEVKFFSGSGTDTLVSVSSVSSTAWYHTDDGAHSDQSPSKLIDENTGTKLCCGGPPLVVAFTFSADSEVASYDLWTADDTPDRDPTSWSLHCAIGGEWRELDSHTDFDVSGLGRKTAYGLPNLVSPPPPHPPGKAPKPPPPSPPSPPPGPPGPPLSPPSPLAACLAVCASYTLKCHEAEVGCGGCTSYDCMSCNGPCTCCSGM